MTPRYWMARLTLSLWALCIPIGTLFEVESFAHRMLDTPPGIICMLLLAFFSLVSLFDVVFNDIGGRRLFPSGLNHRHAGFMGMALVLALLSGVITAGAGRFTATVVFFVVPAVLLVALTFLDINARHRALKAAT